MDALEEPGQPARSRLETGLRVTFAILGFFVVASQLLFVWLPTATAADEVNVAGRQRMLSQRVRWLTEAIVADPDGEATAQRRLLLAQAAQQMLAAHVQLVRSESHVHDERLQELYRGDDGITAYTDLTTSAALEVAALTPEELGLDHPAVGSIREATEPLLGKLEAATQRHEEVAAAHGHRLRWWSQGFSVVALLGLAVAWVYVFRPLLRALRRESDSAAQRDREKQAREKERAFEARLGRALDMARSEGAVLEIAGRALDAVDPDRPAEMLLADNSRAHLRVGAVATEQGRAGCHVTRPGDCAAMTQGRVMQFRSSSNLDACPMLRDRGPHCSGTCAPVTFMGQTLGVLHQIGKSNELPSAAALRRFSSLAAQVGTRLGTVRSFARVEQQAQTDPLTGMLNRRAFEEKMRVVMASGQGFSLSLVDLDRFKKLNDTYGHDAGDSALRTFAKVAKANCRAEDLICRWGGEEFVIVWPGAPLSVAHQRLETLRTELARTNEAQPGHPSFTSSFGLADHRMATDWREVVHLADEALFEAKQQGRDRIVVASSEDEELGEETPAANEAASAAVDAA